MKLLRVTLPVLLALLLALTPSLTLAQDLSQHLDWPEVGFSMAYPAGWGQQSLDDQTEALSADPNYDLQGPTAPSEPVVVIATIAADMATTMGEPADILRSFVGGFDAGSADVSETSFAGLSAFRMATDSEADNISLDVVLLTGDTFYYIVLAITPLGSMADFTPTFEAMLDTVSLSAPVTATESGGDQAAGEQMMISAVRVTVNQSLTGAWNEIDAVELVGTDENGQTISQWASLAEATSQYGEDSWSAMQATGEPDTPECGDFTTAWASETADGVDSLTLSYLTPVAPSAVNVYETYNPGAIVQVELLPDSSEPITVFEGTDTTTPCPGVFAVPVDPALLSPALVAAEPPSTTPVNGVRITLDQSIVGSWNEIDAVELVGTTEKGADLNQWASGAEATSQYGDDSWSAMQATGEPDTPDCGDFTTAWASESATGQDTLTLTYTTPVLASQVNIYENYNPGSITTVELLPADGSAPIAVFTGVDNSTACPGVLSIDVTGGSGALSYGQTVSGEITDAAPSQEWRFQGTGGDSVTITMASADPNGELDPYLSLQDATGRELTYNDDSGSADLGSYDAQISSFVLPGDGQYVVVASRFGEEFGSGTGAYTLTLDKDVAAGPVGTLSFGSSVTGEISDSAFFQDWTFEGTAGDIVIITMQDTTGTGALDPYLYLFDPAGALVAENDDGGDPEIGDLDSQISGFTLPSTGTYRVRATRYDDAGGTTAGTYELSLSRGG